MTWRTTVHNGYELDDPAHLGCLGKPRAQHLHVRRACETSDGLAGVGIDQRAREHAHDESADGPDEVRRR